MNTYLAAAIGGILIGLSATIMLGLMGRIAGICGMINGVIEQPSERSWRFLFLLGLSGGAFLFHSLFGVPIPLPNDAPQLQMILAGLLVGFGTRLGNGCTSGHGICGMGLSSMRSITATLTFMATGFATVFFMRHILG